LDTKKSNLRWVGGNEFCKSQLFSFQHAPLKHTFNRSLHLVLKLD
jgi:hypothetical protein